MITDSDRNLTYYAKWVGFSAGNPYKCTLYTTVTQFKIGDFLYGVKSFLLYVQEVLTHFRLQLTV